MGHSVIKSLKPMIASNTDYLSLQNLQDGPPKTLTDALQASKRLISQRTGIISRVEFDNLAADDPSVYFARTTPANNIALNGMEALDYGDATSIEPVIHSPVSTGLACGPNLASAIYKGILEVIERDAFMIMWQNQLPCPRIDLSTVQDSFIQSFLNELSVLPVECQVYLVPSDIGVPMVMILLLNNSGAPPYTVIGMSADLNPYKALLLAVEEVCWGWLGMSRYAMAEKDYKPSKDYSNVDTLTRHALAYAVDPNLFKSFEFLNLSGKKIAMQDIDNRFDESMVNNIQHLVDELKKKGLNVIAKDLTTVDVDEAGFKVIRAVVPGMQNLDINHTRRYLGGKRLYEVPCQMGLRSQPLTEEEVNPYPHMFP